MNTSPNGSKCLLPARTIRVVEGLCTWRDRPSPFNLDCLSTLLEAVLLYDEVLAYPYRPFSDSIPEWDLDRQPLLRELIQGPQACVRLVDPYEGFSQDQLITGVFDAMGSYMRCDGSVVGNALAGDHFARLMRAAEVDPSAVESLVQESLEILGVPHELDGLIPRDRERFVLGYAGQRISHTNEIRGLAARHKPTGVFILPHWAPFWQHERDLIKSSLHARFRDAEGALLATYLSSSLSIDTSPLVVIALNRIGDRAMLPEAVTEMRKEFRELRSAGSAYGTALQQASTYREVADVVKEWGQAWDAVLRRISSHTARFPLLRRIFAWDVIKDPSPATFFLNTIRTVVGEATSLAIARRLSVVGRLENEFLTATRLDKRVLALFGEYATSEG